MAGERDGWVGQAVDQACGSVRLTSTAESPIPIVLDVNISSGQ